MNYLFSIIIPLYNNEKYIKECLDSVLSQQYSSWEIIIVDDESTDLGLNIAQSLATKNRKIKIIEKMHSGVSDTRNIGLDKATGKYVIFLDSDDKLTDNALTIISDIIEKYEPDFIKGGNITFGDSTEINIPKNNRLFNSVSEWGTSDSLPLNISGCIYKNEIITNNKITFSSGVSQAEDQEFILKYIANCSSIYTLATPLYGYRIHPDSASASMSSFNHNNAICHLQVALNLLEYFHQKDMAPETYNVLFKCIESIIKKFFVYLLTMPKYYKCQMQAAYNIFYKKASLIDNRISSNILLHIATIDIRIYLIIVKLYIQIRRVWKQFIHIL